MLSGGDEYGEQVFKNEIFPKGFARIGDCARITFGADIKIAGKIDFCTFCKSRNFYKILSNPKDIVIFRPLGIASTN
jgi:hypothetical protein